MCKSTNELLSSVEALQAQVKALSERLAQLEGKPTSPDAAAVAPTQAKGKAQSNGSTGQAKSVEAGPEPISEDIIAVICAAIAAFMGERYHIRQIRLISSRNWAMQGRVSIQASHHLHY